MAFSASAGQERYDEADGHNAPQESFGNPGENNVAEDLDLVEDTLYNEADGKEPSTYMIYFDNRHYSWDWVYAYVWFPEYFGEWRGDPMEQLANNLYVAAIWAYDGIPEGIIFNEPIYERQPRDLVFVDSQICVYGNGGKLDGEIFTPIDEPATIYYDNDYTDWWDTPDVDYCTIFSPYEIVRGQMTHVEGDVWTYTFPAGTFMFCLNNNGEDSIDYCSPKDGYIYNYFGRCYEYHPAGIENVIVNGGGKAQYFNLLGIPVDEPSNGVFIKVENGKKTKVYIAG